MRSSRRPRTTAGFSLLETMIALTILAVGMLGMLSMQLTALGSASTGRHVSDAARIGLDQLESLKYQAWAATPVGGWTAPIVVTGPEAVAAPTMAAGGATTPQQFNVSWRVSNVTVGGGFAPIVDAIMIDVRVTWREAGDSAASPLRRYAVSSFKYRGPGTP